MSYESLFDIIGPIMVGPSSSHTAGAAKIGKIAYELFGGIPDKATIILYGSFAKTHKGHGTDIAIIAGLLGFSPDDERIRNAFAHAKKSGMDYNFVISDKPVPNQNTAEIRMKSASGKEMTVVGVSVGGGKINIINIDGFAANISGDNNTLLVFHTDEFGAIALVTGVLAANRINVGHMESSRANDKENALMIIEADADVNESLVDVISELPLVKRVIFIKNTIM